MIDSAPVSAARTNAPRSIDISPARCIDRPTSNTPSKFSARPDNQGEKAMTSGDWS
jgi:hypothetical protein